jgi:glyceraldehyde 3-phosphate dehydrogenase
VHGRFPWRGPGRGRLHDHRGEWPPLRADQGDAERDPTKLPWQGVDVAAECTGIFTNSDKAALLLQAGARKVLVSAP